MIEFESAGSNPPPGMWQGSTASIHRHMLLTKPTEYRAPKRAAAICCFLTLIIWMLSTFAPSQRAFLGCTTAEAADITYVYDNLGRLVGVVDPSGNTATYTYDSVGNLLSIANHASTQVSIISFTPTSGPVGTSVSIFGSGFSPTASQDSVTFNGVAAIVTAATSTTLTTTVPTGATTGVIRVTAPGKFGRSGDEQHLLHGDEFGTRAHDYQFPTFPRRSRCCGHDRRH